MYSFIRLIQLNMISWLEKNYIASLIIVFVIGGIIFYLSSLSFTQGSGGASKFKAIAYHLVVFAFFSLFLCISLTKGKEKKWLLPAILLAVIYGITDELHQFLVPSRSSSFFDAIIDSFGILIASTLYLARIEHKNNT